MITLITDRDPIEIPEGVNNLASFLHWTECEEFPQQGHVWWLRGKVWIDISREQVFTHLAVKNEFYFVLTGLVKASQLGLFLPDGQFLSNFAADIAGNPDGTFLSRETLQSDRIRLIEGAEGGYTETQGSPDMVLEVVSKGSVAKDTNVLRKAYGEAEVREYWLVDARREPLKFDILRHTSRGYVATRKEGGWVKSAVFGKAFQLKRGTNALGHPEFTLSVR